METFKNHVGYMLENIESCFNIVGKYMTLRKPPKKHVRKRQKNAGNKPVEMAESLLHAEQGKKNLASRKMERGRQEDKAPSGESLA